MIADPRFARNVEAVVESAEKRTDAEIVVVVAERSGHYRDVALGYAALGSLLWFVVQVLAPIDIPVYVALPELVVCFLLLTWLLNARPVMRWLVSGKRQAVQVHDAAAVEFLREAVQMSPHHTGVLVYVSALERRVEVRVDVGIDGRVPPGELNAAAAKIDPVDQTRFLSGLEALGNVLAAHIPPLTEDRFDLPNTPRMRT